MMSWLELWTINNAALQIRHVVVRKRKKHDGRIEWRAIEAENFPTVRELIENYIASRRPINPEVIISHSFSSCLTQFMIGRLYYNDQLTSAVRIFFIIARLFVRIWISIVTSKCNYFCLFINRTSSYFTEFSANPAFIISHGIFFAIWTLPSASDYAPNIST